MAGLEIALEKSRLDRESPGNEKSFLVSKQEGFNGSYQIALLFLGSALFSSPSLDRRCS
jgi:hypothetical protein